MLRRFHPYKNCIRPGLKPISTPNDSQIKQPGSCEHRPGQLGSKNSSIQGSTGMHGLFIMSALAEAIQGRSDHPDLRSSSAGPREQSEAPYRRFSHLSGLRLGSPPAWWPASSSQLTIFNGGLLPLVMAAIPRFETAPLTILRT